MIIGLYGLDFGSNNLGCVALSYGFIEILKSIFQDENVDLISFDECDMQLTNKLINSRNITVTVAPKRSLKSFSGLSQLIQDYKKCDLIFDFTAGDSFSDIYSKNTFYTRSIRKELVIYSKTPLILGSQTYGPFKSKLVSIVAAHIIKNSFEVFSRDNKSSSLIRKISKRNPIETLDVAFALPYTRQTFYGKKKKIGVNPSGLLWSGGYEGNNQFGLKIDYKEFCVELITLLLKQGNYDVYLISHVRSKDLSSRDNDMVACQELKRLFPQLVDSPFFDTPMEAKSYISGLDYFVGSRMHATIAAFTSGVVTIPIAYSRKFEGLFQDLDYPYVINATEDNKTTILKKIFDILENEENTRTVYNKSLNKSIEMREFLTCEYEKVIKRACHGEVNER